MPAQIIKMEQESILFEVPKGPQEISRMFVGEWLIVMDDRIFILLPASRYVIEEEEEESDG